MKWHCEMSLWAYSWSISTKRQEYSKLLNAKKKLSSSTITALFWLLDHTYQANSCLKKQSRALAVDKYSSPVQIHLFQWYQPTKRFGACPLSSGCVKLMYVIWSAPSEQVNWVSVSYWLSFFSELALLRKEGSLWWLDVFTTLPASIHCDILLAEHAWIWAMKQSRTVVYHLGITHENSWKLSYRPKISLVWTAASVNSHRHNH